MSGGGLIGMETADFLIGQGSRVTLIEALPNSPVLPFASHGYMLHKRFRQGGGRMILGAKLLAVEPDGVRAALEGREEKIGSMDQVVMAVGMKPVNGLQIVLEELNMDFKVVGDAVKPRRIIEAVEEGARAAWGNIIQG